MAEQLVGGIVVSWQGKMIELGLTVANGTITLTPDNFDGDLFTLAEGIVATLARHMKG
jgi:hypothetical protein